MRAFGLGVLLLLVPGLVALMAVRSGPEVRTWAQSPEIARPTTTPVPHWDRPATESLALLREVAVNETKLAAPALAACETHARRAAKRNVAFRKCALRPLARLDGFAAANGRMLSTLAGAARDACRQRMMNLGGLTAALGETARNTLRGALSLKWAEVLAASETIRAFAREVSKLARERGWKSSCRALPERDRATGHEPVA